MSTSVCVSGTTSPATMRNGESNRRYLRHRRNLENMLKYGVFALFKSYGVKKPTMCLPRYHMALMERHFARNFEDRAFSGSNGRLQATWQRATSLSAVQLVQSFCFCSLRYTLRCMFVNACAFSEPGARATAPRPAK